MSEIRYWIWLSSLEIRARVKNLLLARYGGPRELYYAPKGEYSSIAGLNEREIALLENKSLERADDILGRCFEKNIKTITAADAAFPNRLAALYDPPVVLYVRGNLPTIDDEAAVAVVGTRSASPYGLRTAQRLGYEISACGGLVISGLTAGIDAAAAQGALRCGGRCVGVLGTAIDSSWGGELARSVWASGALVSEYAPGTVTQNWFYRERNRITAGLAVCTVVVEAPEKSGALLFADEASSQGKEVFAVPGNIDAPNSAGIIALMRDGAIPVSGGWDILSGYSERFRGRLKNRIVSDVEFTVESEDTPEKEPAKTGTKAPRVRKSRKKDVDKPETEDYIDLRKQLENLSEEQLAVVSAIKTPGTHIDDIIERSGLTAAQVLSNLTLLQIDGYVTQEPGKRFSLSVK